MNPSVSSQPGTALKQLLIIGTGGTIAGVGAVAGSPVGYRAGALPIDQLLTTIPSLSTLGHVRTEQIFSIASESMSSQHWLRLARRLRQLMKASRTRPDAIVMTHGTDTMEETAFFLSLVLPSTLPLILTGAMRPSTALDADGPGNLYKACRFALAASEAGIGGTFVAFGDQVFKPDSVVKYHANEVLAFRQRFGHPVAWMESDRPIWQPPQDGLQAALAQMKLPSVETRAVDANGSGTASALPKVAVLMQHVDSQTGMIEWLLDQGYKGIVLAGTGIGTMPASMRAALAAARRQGCLIVRATRVSGGYVGRNTEADPVDSDEALDFITAGWLDPLKARILLQLCLHAGNTDTRAIQALFNLCHP